MKHMKHWLMTVAVLLCSVTANAHDFEKYNICYNIISDTEVTVTYYGKSRIDLIQYYRNEIGIPSGVTYNSKSYTVTSIGNEAFYCAEALTKIGIPSTITSIGNEAFFGCSRLTDVTMANSVTTIGNSAFAGCSGLTSITIPNSVATIGQSSFYGCSGLTCITIPNSVTNIGQSSFYGCSGLTSIVVESGNTVYDSRDNCNAIIETATNILISGCNATFIPNSVTSIGPSAFGGYSGLTSITIPNSVTTIGEYAFHRCSGLTSITIPNSVITIGQYAFYGCSGLTSINCNAEIPPTCITGAFQGVDKSIPVYVPASSVNAYKAADGWKEFTNIQPILSKKEILDNTESFSQAEDEDFDVITYKRTFKNTNWNALYVPFEIPLSALVDNYDIAYINDIHTWANEESGEIENMTMEVIKITDTDAVLNANHPYLIRPKNEAAKEMNLVVTNTTLYATEEVTLDCSSMYTKFEVTGSYRQRTVEDLEGSLVLGGGTWITMTEGTMNPFRLFLTISNREGSPVKISPEAAKSISIRTRGEDDNTTDIERIESANKAAHIYDLQGRCVSAPQKGGLYIVNGKKVVY